MQPTVIQGMKVLGAPTEVPTRARGEQKKLGHLTGKATLRISS